MKIFIINLASSKDRRKTMEKGIASLPFESEFIDAIDGRKLSELELSNNVFDMKNCELSKGEIGCALSHIKAYQNIVENNIKVALILEDDVNFSNPSIVEKLNLILTQQDLLYSNKPVAIQLEAAGTRCNKINAISLDENIKLYKAYGSFGAASYVINLAGAKRLLTNLQPVRFVADEWGVFVKLGWINLYKFYPSIFSQQTEINSTINVGLIEYKSRRLFTKKNIRSLPLKYRVKHTKNKLKENLNPFNIMLKD